MYKRRIYVCMTRFSHNGEQLYYIPSNDGLWFNYDSHSCYM